jgi:hypothetical protein
MKLLLTFSRVVAVLAILAFIATFPIRSNFAGRAKLAQRIEQSNADSLFDSQGAALGEPQLYIIDDPKAYLDGKGDEGQLLLNENYLKQNSIYPLQLQSVDFFATATRIGSGAALVVFGLGSLWFSSRLKRRAG